MNQATVHSGWSVIITTLGSGGWLTFLTVSVCLAISAAYELIEFAVAKATGTARRSLFGNPRG